MAFTTAEDYAGIVSHRVAAERHTLAGRWLHRLNDVLTVQVNDVFPSRQPAVQSQRLLLWIDEKSDEVGQV